MALNKGKISIKRCDLSLKLMLEGGQSFRYPYIWITVSETFFKIPPVFGRGW